MSKQVIKQVGMKVLAVIAGIVGGIALAWLLRKISDYRGIDRRLKMANLPKILRTNEDVDEMARYTKELLGKAHEAGLEGITISQGYGPLPEVPSWEKLAGKGQFIALRFNDTDKPPRGLVFQVGEEKYIVRAGRSGRLEIEPYW